MILADEMIVFDNPHFKQASQKGLNKTLTSSNLSAPTLISSLTEKQLLELSSPLLDLDS